MSSDFSLIKLCLFEEEEEEKEEEEEEEKKDLETFWKGRH